MIDTMNKTKAIRLIYVHVDLNKFVSNSNEDYESKYKTHMLYSIGESNLNVVMAAASKEELMIGLELRWPEVSFVPIVYDENANDGVLDPDVYGFNACEEVVGIPEQDLRDFIEMKAKSILSGHI